MSDIKLTILNKLRETEQKYNVKIPLAIESGSRGWGFESPDSDYDCRFIYVHKKEWYLSVNQKRDIIEYAADAIYDINGWDLRKVLQHIIKSNAVMFEWLSSNEIYIKDNSIADQLRTLANNFFNPISVSYHYLNIAINKLNEILLEDEAKLKKYFYVLRPIANLNFVYQYMKIPYMEYPKTLSEINLDKCIYTNIIELMQLKAVSDESCKIKRNEMLIKYFQEEINLFEQRLKEMKFSKNRDYEQVDSLFVSIINEVWGND